MQAIPFEWEWILSVEFFQAQLGGIPGIFHLIKSFVNVRGVADGPGNLYNLHYCMLGKKIIFWIKAFSRLSDRSYLVEYSKIKNWSYSFEYFSLNVKFSLK